MSRSSRPYLGKTGPSRGSSPVGLLRVARSLPVEDPRFRAWAASHSRGNPGSCRPSRRLGVAGIRLFPGERCRGSRPRVADALNPMWDGAAIITDGGRGRIDLSPRPRHRVSCRMVPDGVRHGEQGVPSQDNERPVHASVSSIIFSGCCLRFQECQLWAFPAPRLAPPRRRLPAMRLLTKRSSRSSVVSWYEAVTLLRVAQRQQRGEISVWTEAEWERAARGGREGALSPVGGDTASGSAVLQGTPSAAPVYWRTGTEPVGQRRTQRIRPLQHVRQRARVVQRLVCAGVFCGLARAQSARAGNGGAAGVSGGAWRHHIKMSRCAARSGARSTGVSICGLRVSNGVQHSVKVDCEGHAREDQCIC